jgi:hypothetical protein
MSGRVHSLKEAITAIIDTVKHMRKIEIIFSSYSVGGRNGKGKVAFFLGKYEGWLFLLKSKILSAWVEDFFMVLT